MIMSAARETYDRNGFVVFKNVLDRSLLDEVNAHVEWLATKYPHIRPEHFHHPLMRDDAFWVRLVTDERLLDIAEQFLGPNIACFTAHYICKPPEDGYAVLWHQDGAYWSLEPLEALTLWLAVDDCDSANGCLRMLPGTHKLPLRDIVLRKDVPNMLCSSVAEEHIRTDDAVDVCLSAGDVSVHHPNIIHGSEANRSSRRRCGLDIGYIRTSTRIVSKGVYLNPILVRGSAVKGINQYRRWPELSDETTIQFRGSEGWNERAAAMNRAAGVEEVASITTDVREMTMHMISRLQEGSTKTGTAPVSPVNR